MTLLAATIATAWDPMQQLRTGAAPTEGRTAAAADDLLADWLDGVAEREAAGHRDVAASYVAIYAIAALVLPLARHALVAHRAWRLDGATVTLVPPRGWVHAVTITDPSVIVLADDPAAADPDAVVVADEAELRDLVAADIAARCSAVFTGIRARAPFGIRGMWGLLADDLTIFTVSDAERRGEDGEAMRAAATDLLDRIAAAAGPIKNRPTTQALRWRDRDVTMTVRGTCCLLYKPTDQADAWCTTCPLRPADQRADRYRTWLTSTADT